MADTIDYTALIPAMPQGLVEWCVGKSCFKTQYLVFRCGHRDDPNRPGKKERCFHVRCTTCGAGFTAERHDDVGAEEARTMCACGYGAESYKLYRGSVGIHPLQHGAMTRCPHCGAEAKGAHVTALGALGYTDCAWPLVLSKIKAAMPGKHPYWLVAHGYRVERTVDKDGTVFFDARKWEAYIFTNKKVVRCAAHVRNLGGERVLEHWERRSRYSDEWFGDELPYPIPRGVFKGTALENCKLGRYRKISRKRRTVSYLAMYLKRPQLENLVTQGFGYMIDSLIDRGHSNQAHYLDWKEKSPRKMLGLAKPDLDAVRKAQLDPITIKRYERLRQLDAAAPPAEVLHMVQELGWNLQEMENMGEDVWKLARYLDRQAKKHNIGSLGHAFRYWQDYLRDAAAIGYDVKDPQVRYPHNLAASHDRAVSARKYAEDEKLRAAFSEMHRKIAPLAFEADGLLIRPAAEEKELIAEGKALAHCVGGYGKTHTGGSPIFFIRKASAPDEPWFTLQLRLESKTVAQNRGKKNCAPPDEVNAFVDRWLAEIVKPYDFDQKKKPKRAKKKEVAA